MKKNYYKQPLLYIEGYAVEQGFEGTMLNYDETPGMDYGDVNEQWF